jgi:TATA-box binding protein (TBP) (component of TFIID and TFIIIB)
MSVSDYVPLAPEASEEFQTFKIAITLSGAAIRFDPSPVARLRRLFPKARILSEWRKQHPLAFTRGRYNNGVFYPPPQEGLRIEDGEFIVILREDGTLSVGGPRPPSNVLNVIADYVKVLKTDGLYSKDLFAAKFYQIEGKAKLPLGPFSRIDLSKASNYLEEASYNVQELPALVYNMKAMENVQIWLKSNGEIQFATTLQQSNIARALRLLQQSLKEERDVSTEVVNQQTDQPQKGSKFVFCVGCGAKLPVDATFCRSCGKQQPKTEAV